MLRIIRAEAEYGNVRYEAEALSPYGGKVEDVFVYRYTPEYYLGTRGEVVELADIPEEHRKRILSRLAAAAD